MYIFVYYYKREGGGSEGKSLLYGISPPPITKFFEIR